MSKELSEMCPLVEKMAKIWLKLQENGEKKSQMAKVMAKEKYILARTLGLLPEIAQYSPYYHPLNVLIASKGSNIYILFSIKVACW